MAKANRKMLAILLLGGLMMGAARSEADAPPKKWPTQIEAISFGRAAADRGKQLYGRECAFCHVGRNTGTIMLERRLDKGVPAQLHERTDLDRDYVKMVVRSGLMNMPPMSRAEVSDAELDAITAYLAAKKKP